jgi:hypothetical protein
MRKRILIFSIFLWTTANCFGQSIDRDVVSTSGGYANNSDLSVSWTIGEPVTETFASNNFVLYQGFQQGEYIVEVPESNENGINDIYIDVYPNPAGDFLVVDFKDPDKSNFTLNLYSLNGKKIFSKKADPFSKNKYINLSEYQSGTYILKVINKQGSKTFKIIIK